jgi:ACS family allantoate permease-like MFS transporter
MQRFPLVKYMSATVIVWGIVLVCHAATTNFAGLMVCRFFLGAMEGSVTAGFVLIIARWYRGPEQAFRTGVWFSANGLAQVVGGALAYGIARGFSENTSITFSSWKTIFLITGLLTALTGVGIFFFLPDSPLTATWLTEDDCRIVLERLRENQQGVGSRMFKWYQVREALTDIRTYLIFLCMVTADIPNGGITVFFTQLISGYGFDTQQTLLLSMPGGGFQILVNLAFPYIAFRTRQRMITACVAVLLSLFSISLMTGLARDGPTAHRVGQLIGYYILIGNSGSVLILIFSIVSTNVAGYTKKTTVNAITLMGYCVGSSGSTCFSLFHVSN